MRVDLWLKRWTTGAQTSRELIRQHSLLKLHEFHAEGRHITYDVGVGENLPYADDAFDVVVCVDVLEHVQDLVKVIQEVRRTLKPGGLFFFDTINRNPIATFVTITVAEDLLKLLPKGTHDPAMFIKPSELCAHLTENEFTPGKLTGLGPRGINRKGDFTFGQVPTTWIIFMGTAICRK